jgi:hypothetical protein
MGVPHRQHLGSKFTEGARQIWMKLPKLATAEEPSADEVFTRRAVWPRGVLSKIKYGDKLPNRKQALDLQRILEIDPADFDREPRREFAPPAARAA